MIQLLAAEEGDPHRVVKGNNQQYVYTGFDLILHMYYYNDYKSVKTPSV